MHSENEYNVYSPSSSTGTAITTGGNINNALIAKNTTSPNKAQLISIQTTASKIKEKHRIRQEKYRASLTKKQTAMKNKQCKENAKKCKLSMSKNNKRKAVEQNRLAAKKYRATLSTDKKRKATKQKVLARKKCKVTLSTDNEQNIHENDTLIKSMKIDQCVKEAKEMQQRTQCENNSRNHQALVCIICDRFIIGTEKVHHLSKEQILKHNDRIGIKSYEAFYNTTLHPQQVEQYEIHDMKGLLLSPRSRRVGNEFIACASCHSSMEPLKATSKIPPKFSIANGFVIGSIPSIISYKKEDGTDVTRNIEPDEITDVMRSLLAPTRPFGYVFAYTGGAHKSLHGHYQFFQVDHSRIGGALSMINNSNIYCVMCGRMTPSQKEIVRRRAKLDTELFKDIFTWFIKGSRHHGFEKLIPPESCPQPHVMEENETTQNTDTEINRDVEVAFEGATYFFSSPLDPSEQTGVYDSSQNFALAIINRSAPTLLVAGGTYASAKELLLENVLPVHFPFGTGGPTMPRRNKISKEVCIPHYLRLSLPQFLTGDFILVANHIHNRLLSYKSGVISCKSNLGGISLAEKVSTLTTEDFKNMEGKSVSPRQNDSLMSNSSTAIVATSPITSEPCRQFLKAISTTCRSMGHTTEAAQYARRKCFALNDYFGLNSLFLSITPCDECSFRVRLYAMAGRPHTIPSLQCSEDECIADYNLRKTIRQSFPGACSLEYQSAMQIVTKLLLGWNIQCANRKRGILGKILAYVRADEEQGRKTLHGHWQLWVEMYAALRRLLYNGYDERERVLAKKEFISFIDSAMSASFGDQFEISHTCKDDKNTTTKNNTLVDCSDQEFRNARNKDMCQEIDGKVMQCTKCMEKVSTIDTLNIALREWRKNAIGDADINNLIRNRIDTEIPISRYRLDIAAYTYSYHMNYGCLPEKDPFWGNPHIRKALLRYRFDHHNPTHCNSCFKKNHECRFFHPFKSCTDTMIHEDRGPDDENIIKWYDVRDGSSCDIPPYMILPKRPQGCQFINSHSVPISDVLNCNTNVQIGDASQVFYSTLYTSKSTQDEDSERQKRISTGIIRRMLRIQQEAIISQSEDKNKDRGDFVEGLCRVLSGINASTSRSVVSSTMAHLITSQGGSRFTFSHNFQNMLVGQMEDMLDGKETNFIVRTRTNRGTKNDSTPVTWPDSSAQDYLYRPDNEEFNNMCLYEMTMNWIKFYKTFKVMGVENNHENDNPIKDITNNDDSRKVDNEKSYRFIDDHPGHKYCRIKQLKHLVIPKVSLPPEKQLCRVKDLQLTSNSRPTPTVQENRENYAKLSLIMFYKGNLRKLSDIQDTADKTFWTKFQQVKRDETLFWSKGIDILQNIEDRKTLEKDLKRAQDPVTLHTTKCISETEKNNEQPRNNDDENLPDIADYCMEDNNDDDLDSSLISPTVLRSHSDIIDRSPNIKANGLIHSRIASKESILYNEKKQKKISTANTNKQSNSNDTTGNTKKATYSMMLKMISGTLVGDNEYDAVYNNNEKHLNTANKNENDISIPTLASVARKVADLQGKKLDKKQYASYEIIACSFLLQLIQDGSNKNSDLGKLLGITLSTESQQNDTETITDKLHARGGKDQLIMFLTGPAGSGKSTAIKIAQRFCFEFCLIVSIMWTDMTFFFTAYTGSAASLFGGVTICKAAFLNSTRELTSEDKAMWKDVRMLIIDEISFMKDCELQKLDKQLKKIFNKRNEPFGGLSIVFAGDFRQMEPCNSSEKDLLYTQDMWENNINVVIILENGHRFKDDPWYGNMLSRMWTGNLTQEDRIKINSRVIGNEESKGIELPKSFEEGCDVCYACPTNKERNAITAGIFREHIKREHPVIESKKNPPDHTIMVEAKIESSIPKKKNHQTLPIKINEMMRHRILTTCGDADVMVGTKHIDPLLRLYVGGYFMCIDNNHLSEGRGNGTLCRVIKMRLKETPKITAMNWEGRKVNTVNISEVHWVKLEHYPKSDTILQIERQIEITKQEIETCCDLLHKVKSNKQERTHTPARAQFSTNLQNEVQSKEQQLQKLENNLKKEVTARQFKLKPESYTTTVKIKIHPFATSFTTFKCKMTQIPLNANDATTGHKLQGMSKDVVIVTSWPSSQCLFKNWEYVVLSRVRSLSGLFLFHPIDLKKDFSPSDSLISYLNRAKTLETTVLNERERLMNKEQQKLQQQKQN